MPDTLGNIEELSVEDQKKLYAKKPKVQHYVGLAAGEVDEEKHEVSVLISNEVKNRRNQVVLNSAFQAADLKPSRKIPLLSSHNSYSLSGCIGRWKKFTVTDKGVLGTAEYFDVDTDGEAAKAWSLIKHKMGAFSIGFNVMNAVVGPEDVQKEKSLPLRVRKSQPYVVFTEIELLEVSQCVIPVNPAAIQNALLAFPEYGEIVDAGVETGYFEHDPRKKSPEPTDEDKTDFAVIKLQMATNKMVKHLHDATSKELQKDYMDELFKRG